MADQRYDVDIFLNDAPLRETLLKIDKQVGLTAGQIKQAIGDSLSKSNFADLFKNLNTAQAKAAIENLTKTLKDFSQEGAGAARVASLAVDSLARKIKSDLNAAGLSKDIKTGVSDALRQVQAEFSKNKLNFDVKLRFDEKAQAQFKRQWDSAIKQYNAEMDKAQKEQASKQAQIIRDQSAQTKFNNQWRAENRKYKQEEEAAAQKARDQSAADKVAAQAAFTAQWQRENKQYTREQNEAARQQYLGIKNDLAAGKIMPQQAAAQYQGLLASGNLSQRGADTVNAQYARLQGQFRREAEKNATNIYGQLKSQYDDNGRKLDSVKRDLPKGSSSSGSSSSNNVGYQLQNALFTIGFSTLAIAAQNLARSMVAATAAVEQYQRRLSIVIKDPRQSEQYYKFLRNYEKITSYELPEVLNAGTAFATQTRQLGRAGLTKESAVKLAGELGSLNPDAGIIEGQRALSRIIAGDPNGLEILRSKFAITNEILKEGGAKVTDSGVSLQSVKNRKAVITAIDKFIQDTTGGVGAVGQNSTLAGRLSTLQSQIFSSMADVMEKITPALKGFTNGLIDLLEAFDKIPSVFKEIIGYSVLATSGMFSAAAGISGLVIVADGISTAFGALEKAMAGALVATQAEVIAEGEDAATKGLNVAATEAEIVAEATLASTRKKSFLATPVSALLSGAGNAAGGLAGGIRGLLSYLGIGAIGGTALGIGALGTLGVAAYQGYQDSQSEKEKKANLSSFLGATKTGSRRKANGDVEDINILGLGAKYENAYVNNGQDSFFEWQVNNAFNYGSEADQKNIRQEAGRRKRRLEGVLVARQQLSETLPKNTQAFKDNETKIKDLATTIAYLGDVADGAKDAFKDLGNQISLIIAKSQLGNNNAQDQIAQIQGLPEYKRIAADQKAGKLSPEDEIKWYGYQNQLKGLRERSDTESSDLSLAQKANSRASRGGANQQERIADLAQKAAAIRSDSQADAIKKIQAETALLEEQYKRDMAFKERRIQSVRMLKGEEKARILEINKAEADQLRDLGPVLDQQERDKMVKKIQIAKDAGKIIAAETMQSELNLANEIANQEKLIRAKADADRIAAHVDMLKQIRDAESTHLDELAQLEKSKKDRQINRLTTEKGISETGEQFMTDNEKLANLDKVQEKENKILELKRAQTQNSIADIAAKARKKIGDIQDDLSVPGRIDPTLRGKKLQEIEDIKKKAKEDQLAAQEEFQNLEATTKSGQTAERKNRTKASDLETYDNKIGTIEQRKAELDLINSIEEKKGNQSEFTRINNLQKSFEMEKKLLELKADRAKAELPENAEAEKANITRKLRLDILNLQQQYLDKAKQTGDELDRQNRILELQKKIKEQPAIYGIDQLNQRMQDESELFRLQAGFGGKSGKGKGPYPGYGPKVYPGYGPRPDFTFGDPSIPQDLKTQTANDVFSAAGEKAKKGPTIPKLPKAGEKGGDVKLPDISVGPIIFNHNGQEIFKESKKFKLSEFNNKNTEVKDGGKGMRNG